MRQHNGGREMAPRRAATLPKHRYNLKPYGCTVPLSDAGASQPRSEEDNPQCKRILPSQVDRETWEAKATPAADKNVPSILEDWLFGGRLLGSDNVQGSKHSRLLRHQELIMSEP